MAGVTAPGQNQSTLASGDLRPSPEGRGEIGDLESELVSSTRAGCSTAL